MGLPWSLRARAVTLALACALPGSALVLPGCLEGDPSPLDGAPLDAGDAAADAATAPDGASPPGAPATVPETRLCSGASSNAVTVTFENASARPLRVWWVDRSCAEVPYADVAPGGRHEQPTFYGHPWRVRDRDTGALYREYVPTEGGPLVVRVP